MGLTLPTYDGDTTSISPVANAFCDVLTFSLDKRRHTIDFSVGFYRSKADYDADREPIASRPYHITPNPETRADGATIPPFATVLGLAATHAQDPAGTLAFTLVDRAIVMFLLSLPEFAGATPAA